MHSAGTLLYFCVMMAFIHGAYCDLSGFHKMRGWKLVVSIWTGYKRRENPGANQRCCSDWAGGGLLYDPGKTSTFIRFYQFWGDVTFKFRHIYSTKFSSASQIGILNIGKIQWLDFPKTPVVYQNSSHFVSLCKVEMSLIRSVIIERW